MAQDAHDLLGRLAFQAIVEKLLVQAFVSVERVVVMEAQVSLHAARVSEREVSLVLREVSRFDRRKADIVSSCNHAYPEDD